MRPLQWTDLQDKAIRSARRLGTPWSQIASQLGVSREATIQRAIALGIYTRRAVAGAGAVEQAGQAKDPTAAPIAAAQGPIARPPLPPGHPDCWQLLSTEPYPLPVFLP